MRFLRERWCHLHHNQIKRGTKRCMSCRSDLSLAVRPRHAYPTDLLKATGPKAGHQTKRAVERRQKGYVS